MAKYKIPIFRQPVNAPRGGQKFGAPRPNGRIHEGDDFSVKDVTYYAYKDGRAVLTFNDPLGQMVIKIIHDNGDIELLSHCSRFLVQNNERVKAGQPVAITGGNPKHAHVQYKKNGKWISIFLYFTQDTAMTGTPIKQSGNLQVSGSPELINDAGNKSGAYAGNNVEVPFSHFRTSKWSDGGGIEFKSSLEGNVWIHINDTKWWLFNGSNEEMVNDMLDINKISSKYVKKTKNEK